MTKVGMIPPIANPIFQSRAVPLARTSVGKRSLRNTRSGTYDAAPKNYRIKPDR